jgi:hypothetical protein
MVAFVSQLFGATNAFEPIIPCPTGTAGTLSAASSQQTCTTSAWRLYGGFDVSRRKTNSCSTLIVTPCKLKGRETAYSNPYRPGTFTAREPFSIF